MDPGHRRPQSNGCAAWARIASRHRLDDPVVSNSFETSASTVASPAHHLQPGVPPTAGDHREVPAGDRADDVHGVRLDRADGRRRLAGRNDQRRRDGYLRVRYDRSRAGDQRPADDDRGRLHPWPSRRPPSAACCPRRSRSWLSRSSRTPRLVRRVHRIRAAGRSGPWSDLATTLTSVSMWLVLPGRHRRHQSAPARGQVTRFPRATGRRRR